MNRTELKLLKSLRDAPLHGLPWSRLPASCVNLMNRLCTCGAVQVVPGRQGKRIRVANAEAFERIVRSSSPHGLNALDSVPENRADAVEQFGDAKAVGAGSVQGVFVRTSKPNVGMRRTSSPEIIDVTALTRLAGGAAILLGAGADWSFSGTVATIENEEAFWQHELILPEIDLAVYVRGKMSNRVLRWLASAPMAGCEFTHWGDYDPVGVLEYVRLKLACPGRVRLHVPEGLDKLVARYGKRRLIQAGRQTAALSSLRLMEGDATVNRMIQVFDQHGKGVEQELLLALAKKNQ